MVNSSQIVSQKIEVKGESKIGSLDNVGHKPGKRQSDPSRKRLTAIWFFSRRRWQENFRWQGIPAVNWPSDSHFTIKSGKDEELNTLKPLWTSGLLTKAFKFWCYCKNSSRSTISILFSFRFFLIYNRNTYSSFISSLFCPKNSPSCKFSIIFNIFFEFALFLKVWRLYNLTNTIIEKILKRIRSIPGR